MQTLKNRLVRLLRASERYAKTDMVYLTTGGFWLGVGQVVASGSAFLLAIAFANLLAPETYGTYRFILSTVGILAIPTLGGINTAIAQSVSRGIEGPLKRGIKLRLQWGLLGSVGSIALAIYYLINGNTQLASAFLVAAPFIPLFETFGIYSVYLQSKQLFQTSTIYFIALRIIYVAALIGTAVLASNGVLWLLIVYFVVLSGANALLLLRTLKKIPPNNTDEAGVLRYGKHLSLLGVIGRVGLYIDSLLLFHFIGPVQVAQYAFARAPIDQITAAYKSIPLLALPKLSRKDITDINQLIWQRVAQLAALGLIIAAVYAIATPFVFSLLFPKYLSSVLFSQLLAVTIALQLPFSFINTAVQSRLHETPTSWLYWRSVPQGIYILSLLALIPAFGIIGVIFGRILLTILQGGMYIVQWFMFVASTRNTSNLEE